MGLFDKLFGPPGKNKFARLLIDRLRQAGDQRSFRYDPDEFRIVIEGDTQAVYNLQNVYAEYCAAPRRHRSEALRRIVRALFSARKEIPTEFADARSDLLPVVCARAYFEVIPLQMKVANDSEHSWPYRVIGEHLGLGLAYELPEAMHMIVDHELRAWGVSHDGALAVALENLAAMSQHRMESVMPGLWRSPWRDNYDSARLVLLDFLRQHEVDGDLIAMVPDRDTLLLTGSKDHAAMEKMVRLAEEALQGPRSMSGVAYRLVGDERQPYLPEEDSPLYTPYKILQVKTHGQDYAEQKELLERLHQKTGEDFFVANFMAIQETRTGRVQTYSVWGEGVDTLLSQTDTIAFVANVGKGKPMGRANWERVPQVVGELMKPAGWYPERYRVRAFPTEEQLAAIGLELM